VGTVSAREIENFSKDSARWWDENGPFAPLHRLNPVRLSYVKDQICGHYGLDVRGLKPYSGLSLLDIGCGGGLVCEPMARLGGTVTGIDADSNAIEAAKVHAKQSGLEIEYRCASTDELLAGKTPHLNPPPSQGGRTSKPSPLVRGEGLDGGFDAVLALEIVEHVADVDKFVGHCVDLCKPGGLIIFSTLNRTPKSFLLGKVAAEYILGWVPQGTHDWKKFLKPSELSRAVRQNGAEVTNTEGMVFDPLTRDFKRSARDLDVNYFLSCLKPE